MLSGAANSVSVVTASRTSSYIFAPESDMISLNFVGTPVVVVNSPEIAMDIFEKRSSIYSDRSVGSVESESAWRHADLLTPGHEL